MERAWYRHDREAVLAGLRRGERPDMATTRASGPLDEVVALHDALGIVAALDTVAVARERAGLPEALLLRTLAVLPFVPAASLRGAAGALFREPAILLQRGWAPADIRAGCHRRHRHPTGRRPESLPCHPDTRRDELRRVAAAAWRRVQQASVPALVVRRLVRGPVQAIDGSGLGNGLRVVAVVCVSSDRPVIVAWQLLVGSASETGKEATVTRALVEQALALGGPGCIRVLLADALDADGPLLAWLKRVPGIDALVALPPDRQGQEDVQGLARLGAAPWRAHPYGRVVQGHQQMRTVLVASAGALTSWDGFVEAAAGSGLPAATLWACLIREVAPTAQPTEEARALVSTRPWGDGVAALHASRPRWHIENDADRELKEGWGLEDQRWGWDEAAARGRLTLTCLAFNTAQVDRSQAGDRLAGQAIRRLRQPDQPALGAAPAVIYLGACDAGLALEDLLAVVGLPVRDSFLPDLPP